MGPPAEQPPDRLAERLPVYVPERDVDGRVAAHLGAGIARADIDAAEPAVVQLNVARVLAEQIGGDVVVDITATGPGAQNVSPVPTMPASVWTRSQKRNGNSAS